MKGVRVIILILATLKITQHYMNDLLFNESKKDSLNKYKIRLLLSFANGILFGCIFWVYNEFRYESSMFMGLKENIELGLSSKDNYDSVFTRTTLFTHAFIRERV